MKETPDAPASLELDCMKNSISSIPTHRIARALLLTLVTSAACTFFSACVGHQARVENRQDRRADRQERRADRQGWQPRRYSRVG